MMNIRFSKSISGADWCERPTKSDWDVEREAKGNKDTIPNAFFATNTELGKDEWLGV
jgi:hypothetical protein